MILKPSYGLIAGGLHVAIMWLRHYALKDERHRNESVYVKSKVKNCGRAADNLM
jgi:hypothetical protein